MIVEMVKLYRGHQPGSFVELGGGVADLLIRRGIAKIPKPKRQAKTGTTTRKRKDAKRSTAS